MFKIVYHLLEKGRTSAPELAEKLEVSVRTVYRDIDALSEAGIPVYAETGRNGGICLMDDFVLDKAVLSEAEKQEILAALQGLGAAEGQGADTLNKLAALFDTGGESWLEVDFSRWGSRKSDNEKFEALKSAVIRHECANITYAGSDGTIRKRKVWPLKLSYKSKAWYLKAYCTEKKDFRLFKLSRILDWEILNEGFVPCRFPEEAESSREDYPDIVLRFPGEMSYRVYDEFDPADVELLETGELLVRCKMPVDEWLAGFLLSFGGNVEVAEPASLGEMLAVWAKTVYEKYNKSRVS